MSEFRVLTVKEQASASALLEKATAAIAALAALLSQSDAPVTKKPRKPRKAKVVATAPADTVVAPKRRGRPPKAAVESTVAADAGDV